MAKDLWLPRGYTFSDGSQLRLLLFSGDDWQIFDTNGASNVLLARPESAKKWIEFGFMDESLFKEISFGVESFRSLISNKKFALTPVENGSFSKDKVDVLAFALALKESRKTGKNFSFHDSIYVEQYSRLLPTWTPTPQVDDEVVLGTWLTGGVGISTDSFRRLAALTVWMSAGDLSEIIESAGFKVPVDAGLLAKRKPIPRTRNDEKPAVSEPALVSGLPQSQNEPVGAKVFRLPGRPRIEAFFNEHVIDIVFNAEKYQAMGIEFPSAIVLHGPPGCGKTFAVERLVEFIDWPSYSINSNSVGSPFIHETSKKISEIFDKAIENAPSVVVIDEMESLLSDRRSARASGLYHIEEVAEFLRRIPEAVQKKVLIVAMTNLIDMIEPAILRRGRFDHIVEVGMPTRTEVASLLDSLLSKLPKAENLGMDKMLDALTGKALSDAAFVVREAARLAAKAGKLQIDQESTNAALYSLLNDRKSRGVGFVPDE